MAYLDRMKALMADQGTTFNQYFTPNAMCCPSRASTLTGQYSHNTDVFGNGYPHGGYQTFFEKGLENQTVATALQEAGYRTALIGKYLNGYPNVGQETHVPPGWDEWAVRLDHDASYDDDGPGTDHVFYDYVLNENGTLVNYGNTEEDYATDVFTKKAIQFIQERSKQPFFIYLAPLAPHNPSTSAPRYQDKFIDSPSLPMGPNFFEADVSDKPPYIQSLPDLENALPTDPKYSDVMTEMTTRFRDRLRCMLAIEDMIQQIVTTLKQNGQLDNTYIFFTSDNGFHLGQHRVIKGKGLTYEEDIRVPLIVRGPNVQPKQNLRYLLKNSDLAPTFVDLAGSSVPDTMDGKSFKRLLGSNIPNDDASVHQFRRRFLIERPGSWGIRTDFDKYVQYWDDGKITYEELYIYRNDGPIKDISNVTLDPYELENKAYDPAYHARIDALKSWLDSLKICAGKGCRSVEGPQTN
jgi:arylsulfatase A-like enzyme